jgi:hypothetical protein
MAPAPKDLKANIAYRRAILERCATDMKFREACWIRAKRDFVWWCDTFLFTYDPKTHPKRPHRPFILYGYQENGADKLLKLVGFDDILIEKSRQMGVTWLLSAVHVWLWLFYPAQSFLLGSRKEDLIDKPGDAIALFWKLDYILERVPAWMRPDAVRTSRHLENPNNKSTIDGESTNSNFGRGGTKTSIYLDEFQAVENGHQIMRATQAATNCRIIVGTPNGASGAYYDQRQKMIENSPDQVLRFHWSEHPVYSQGLYSIEGCDQGKPPTILDKEYKFPPGFDFLKVTYPQFKLRSIWFNKQCVRASNAQEIASELDIDYLQSGWNFFDSQKLATLLNDPKVAMPPRCRGEIIRDPDWKTPKWMEQSSGGARGGGRLHLWFAPTAEGKVPDNWDDIVIGADIASGSGGEMSSNSSASIVRRSTGEKVGEITDNLINPHDFALYCLALCKWFNGAYLIWERNGPNGAQFGKVVKDEGYRNIFYPTREMRLDFVSSKEPGFWTDAETKAILLGSYAEALWTRSFINHSEPALRECSHYVQNGNKIEHDRSLASATEDPTAIGESHGDRVIADALAFRGMNALSRIQEDKPAPEPPPNSMGGRRLAREREASKVKRRWGRSRVA